VADVGGVSLSRSRAVVEDLGEPLDTGAVVFAQRLAAGPFDESADEVGPAGFERRLSSGEQATDPSSRVDTQVGGPCQSRRRLEHGAS
jgi:hypothetical protein